ncbi:hypothetical protein RHGRI_015247 [Rhododendron griersonianum]|uniref:Kinesin motor domain-containing protein n=1 Tax=Rhododendron griersonianum TaxID=479676 RepID=A0AAV6KD23_9ERIC|nr:hypothetical protein RHGRI_015247 [Rhododendron griersonianum]
MLTPAKPSSSISKVRVIIRVRPFLPHETASRNGNSTPCVSVLGSELDSTQEVTVHLKDPETSRNECYNLDSFFGQEDNNLSKIFHREVSPLIPGIFNGCNATVFAYGATCSGKTYTMQGTDEIPGLIPQAMSTVLSLCHSTGSTAEISYYEVYMDRCYDLMEVKPQEIAVMEDKDGEIHLKGLSKVPVNSMPEFHEVFSRGNQRRKVAHTGLNDVSSRSHGVLAITVSSPCGEGNEDNRRTCNEGIRLQESAKINQSLFALSNVIYALNNNRPRVPYRESKLTRILQDSLGGSSRALMVACLNPGEYQESVHTVSLAARSRHISNFVSSAQKHETPKFKVDMEAKLRAWLESKGKTKSSAQKMGAFGSPLIIKTPSAMSSTKKPKAYSSAKQKSSTFQSASTVKERSSALPRRNLFTNVASVDPSTEKDMNLRKVKDCSAISKDGGSRKFSIPQSDGNIQPHTYNALEATIEETATEDSKVSTDMIVLETRTCTPDKLSDKAENMEIISHSNFDESSPICEKIKALQSSLRRVLSPINSNINVENKSSRDQICLALLDPKTPKTPFLLSCPGDKSQKIGTPLDKLNSLGSNLKSSLVQEYVDFLNQASREELMGLKGIGQKMAEYILELRETSPLKSLNDLEKIGLSSKQVHNMFNRTARGLFG